MSTLRDMRQQVDSAWDAVIRRMAAGAPLPPRVSSKEAIDLLDKFLRAILAENTVAAGFLVFSNVKQLLEAGGKHTNMSNDAWQELRDYYVLLFRWKAAGYPMINLSESLSAALYLTDVAQLPANLWQLPHDPVVVKLPSPSVLRITSSDGQSSREATVILVGRLRGFLPETMARHGQDPYGALPSGLEVFGLFTHLEPEAVTRQVVRLIPEPIANFTTVFSDRRDPIDGDTFGAWSARYDTEIEPTHSEIVATEDDTSAIANAWRVLMALWRYLDEVAPGAAAPGGLNHLQMYREGKGQTYRLGRDIKIDAPRAVLSSIGTAGWKIHSRFMVRGHFKNQPFGPGRDDRRRIWLKPYWKGPKTAAEVLERAYSAGPKTGSGDG